MGVCPTKYKIHFRTKQTESEYLPKIEGKRNRGRESESEREGKGKKSLENPLHFKLIEILLICSEY